jgi:hypothetical protein
VDVWDERIHADHELGAVPDRDIDVRRGAKGSVDICAVADVPRRVEKRDGGGRRGGLRDRRSRSLVRTEDDPLRGVQIRSRDEELVPRLREVVAAAGGAKERAMPVFGSVGGVEGRREPLGQRTQAVDDRGGKG